MIDKYEVILLGHKITTEGKALSEKRVVARQAIPKPVTVKQVK